MNVTHKKLVSCGVAEELNLIVASVSVSDSVSDQALYASHLGSQNHHSEKVMSNILNSKFCNFCESFAAYGSLVHFPI